MTVIARRARLTSLALMSLAGLAPAALSAATPGSLATSHAEFCIEVQRRLVDTALPIGNRLHDDQDAFKESKAIVDPLETQQFLVRDAAGRIKEISCKTKSADHLRAVHGVSASRDPALPARSCRDIHREMIRQVWAGLEPAERTSAAFAPHRVMLDPDTRNYTGSSWIGSSAEAYLAPDGRLHLRSSALYAEWEDWRWKMMPKSFRGNHYCHLVAPERIRALLRGEERLSR